MLIFNEHFIQGPQLDIFPSSLQSGLAMAKLFQLDRSSSGV